MEIKKRCQWCGEPFIAHKMTTLYCSTIITSLCPRGSNARGFSKGKHGTTGFICQGWSQVNILCIWIKSIRQEVCPSQCHFSSYLDFIIKNIDHLKRIVCFRQISKIRKKTPKFADFLHFEEFSFGFVEDKYKCSNFLLTEICSIPLPTYAKDE